jgi:hypothetical protein
MSPAVHPVSKQIAQWGFAIVPGALPPEKVDKLVEQTDNAFKNRSSPSNHAIRHLLQMVPGVREVAESAAIRCLIEAVLGSSAFVARSMFFDKTPDANWKVAWHQDLTIAVRKKIEVDGYTAWSVKEGIVHVQPPISVLERMVTVRLHLDDCGLENGPLQVIPMSHKSGRVRPASNR